MPAPPSQTVLDAVSDVVAFAHRIGLASKVSHLEVLHAQFQKVKPTLKILQSEVKDASDEAYLAIREHVLDDGLDPRPGNEALAEDMNRVFGHLNDVIYPPKFIEKEMPTTGFAGTEFVESKTVRYMGSSALVRVIFERSIQLVRRYCQLVAEGDLQEAYHLTSPELQQWMSFKRYLGEHKRASQRYGGSPSEFLPDEFGWIFPDNEARNNAEVGRIVWPRYVPKSVLRATVYGFWICNTGARTGCHGGLWITEHWGELQIAKFEFRDE